MSSINSTISMATIKRLPIYLEYLKTLEEDGEKYIQVTGRRPFLIGRDYELYIDIL